MVDIVTRTGKGSPLTNAEVDANFTNLAAVPAPNDGTLTMAVSGTGLSGSASFTADQAGASSFTVTSNATSANTGSAIVARDGSGNFSAGTITAALSGNATTATTLQTVRTIGGVSFNGSANINLPGVNATGNQNTTGTAAVATEVSVTSDSVWAYNYLPFISGSSTGDYALKTDSGIRYNPNTNFLVLDGYLDAASVTADSMSLGDNDTFSFGAGASGLAKLFANGATSTMQLELESAANSFIITDNGTTKFTFTKATGTIEATDFSGGGAALTSLTAANISAGTAGISISGNAATATTLQTARTINGVSFNGSANITVESYVEDDNATNATRYITFVDNTTASYKRLNEDSNLTYNPATNVLTAGTFSGALSGNATTSSSTTGNAATATTLETARTINGVSFNGSANITVPANTPNTLTNGSYLTGSNFNGSAATTWAVDATNLNTASKVVARDASGNFSAGTITAALSGNAATATTLQTARTIGGVSFNGSANIDLPGVNTAGNQNTTGNATTSSSTTGNAATATTLQTARTIGGVSFNGSANINLPGVNAAGNQSTTGNAGSATVLQTARTINGVSFNGSAAITVEDATKLPLAGGTATGTISAPTFNATSTTSGGFQGIDADSATAPSFTWTADLNTGMYRVGADSIGFTAGGTNRLTISTTAVTTIEPITAPTYYSSGTAYYMQPATGISGTTAGSRFNDLRFDSLWQGVPANSGPILTYTLTSGGSGYVDGTYLNKVVSAGGVYATFDFVVSGGVVTTATLTERGTGFEVGDTISLLAAILGGTGSGGSITVNSVRTVDLSLYSPAGRIRLASSDTSLAAGQEIGGIYFNTRDASAGGAGDKAYILGVAEGASGGGKIEFWTSSNGLGATKCMEIAGNNTFRLYNSAGTFYHAFDNAPTANRTLSLPDATGTIALTSSSITGNATTATTLQTARTINGVSFNGSANITVEPYISNDDTGDTNCPIIFSANTTEGHKRLYEDSALYFNNTNNILYSTTFSGALSGNATTATTLQTAKTIGGVSFDGSANINLPGVNITGNQNTTGSSASCTGNAATSTISTNTNSISNATGSAFSWTGIQQFQSNQNTSGANPPLQAYSSSGGAIMAFHRGGVYAVNMGLDSDNVFRIGGWSASTNRLQMDMSGNLTMAGNVTAYSDERLKKDWEEVKPNFVDQLANVKSGTYTRTDSDERQAGVSAQSLQELLPETVVAGNDGMLSVAYGNAAMVAVVELAKEIRMLKEEIKALKGE